MAENQKQILHYVRRTPGSPSVATQAASYERWNKESCKYPWVDMERSLYRPAPTTETAADSEDEDEDEEDAERAEGDDEEEESTQDKEDSERSDGAE